MRAELLRQLAPHPASLRSSTFPHEGKIFYYPHHCRRYSPGVVPSTFLNKREK